jgi:hypothetical protein
MNTAAVAVETTQWIVAIGSALVALASSTSHRSTSIASVDFERVADGARPIYAEISHPWPPNEANACAEYVDLPFALLSDIDLALAASLRLPTSRAAGMDRLNRLTMIVDDQRTIRAVQFPVTDPAASVG